MNDRFKFRVAVKQGLEWQIYDVLNILFKSDGTILVQTIRESESATFTAWWLVDGENVILEQCTGLKDKDGKLIYEGDLLGESKEDDEFVEICWCDTLASFMCDIYPETYGNLETCDVEYLAKLEIFGNIHEMEVAE